MGVKVGIKWERSTKCVPVHNLCSSDFPKYVPQPWKYEEGEPCMSWIIAHEYQRLWIAERDAWQKRMYPDTAIGVDRVKLYVLNFKAKFPPRDKDKKKKKADEDPKKRKKRVVGCKPLGKTKQKKEKKVEEVKKEDQSNCCCNKPTSSYPCSVVQHEFKCKGQ